MADIYIHLGAHKTATSYLQNLIKHNNNSLKEQGIHYLKFKKNNIFSAYHKAVDESIVSKYKLVCYFKKFLFLKRKKSKFAKELNKKAKTLNKKILGLLKKNKKIIISRENLFGGCDLCDKEIIYPRSDDIIRALKTACKGSRVKIIFYIRSNDSFIESTYLQKIQMYHFSEDEIKAGKTTFDNYINSFYIKSVSWLNIIKKLEESFGKENLIIIPYESIKDGKKKYAEAFFSIFSDAQKIDLAPKNIYENRSFSQKAFDIFISEAPDTPKDKILDLRLGLQSKYPVGEAYKKVNLLTDKKRNEILDLFKSENELIFREYVDNKYKQYQY